MSFIHPIMPTICASDYHIATPGIAATAREAFVYKEQRFSDHAPLIVDYDFAPA